MRVPRRTTRRAGAAVVLAAGTVVAGPAAPLAAQPPPLTAEVLRLCGTVTADAAQSSDDLVRGFAAGGGPGCPTDIHYLRGAGASWSTLRTPYRGQVVAAARDDTGTWLLYRATDGLRLGAYTAAGTFAPSRRITSDGADGVTGDVAAAQGDWWVVWTEPTGPFGTGELYQSKTYGGVVERQRLTTNALPDLEPSLALWPGGQAVLAWTRNDAPVEPDGSEVWVGTSTGGPWSTRPVFTAGRRDSGPDVYAFGATHVAFLRDGAPRYADDSSGLFSVSTFPRPEGAEAVQARVGALTGRSYLAWLELGEEFEPIVLATGVGGEWRRQVVTGVGPGGAGSLRLWSVVGRRDGATVLYSAGDRLVAATTTAFGLCVHGAIGAHYAALGGESGLLGPPVTCEAATPVLPGRYNHFERGSIYWSAATGAWEVHGAIRDTWARLGWENSPLGFPVTDETRTPDGRGAYSVFERGSVYWTPGTGAHDVRGAIRGAWARHRWEAGLLGFPLTGETPTPFSPGAFNHFEGGSVYWSPDTGAHEVHGAILARWAGLGWELSPLGFPVSDEYGVPGGRRSDFEGGHVTWTPAGGAVVSLDRP